MCIRHDDRVLVRFDLSRSLVFKFEFVIQWSRTITVHSDRDELIMFIKFLFPYHLQLINPRTLNGRLGHLKCEVIE